MINTEPKQPDFICLLSQVCLVSANLPFYYECNNPELMHRNLSFAEERKLSFQFLFGFKVIKTKQAVEKILKHGSLATIFKIGLRVLEKHSRRSREQGFFWVETSSFSRKQDQQQSYYKIHFNWPNKMWISTLGVYFYRCL